MDRLCSKVDPGGDPFGFRADETVVTSLEALTGCVSGRGSGSSHGNDKTARCKATLEASMPFRLRHARYNTVGGRSITTGNEDVQKEEEVKSPGLGDLAIGQCWTVSRD